ncbi:fasciclin domain-containing protein [Cryptosporangium arvum]|uniref:Secreted/surface protein with fasciclin-like repeats n=1 Tax=Cryptosporangium arvum DSM 44712 TaxID=927661 RepID=A0A010YLM1_9ACTN|nr:fasciclin domain-containing protein [Cryptosporangium arvum]EXG81120.1 secreted/surface protein with fasciclin-like repeats [Cryptosporangium arvum DSM 44712]
MTRVRTRLLGVTTAALLALSMAACSSDDSSDTATTSSDSTSATAMASPSESAMSADAPFGAACSAVPASGSGSFSGMAQDPVATAASNNPVLSTLVTAVKTAGLVDTLNSAKDVTVFAPTNDAFAKIPEADLKKVLADKATLTKILTYHVVGQKITPDQLGTAGPFKSLQGQDVTATGSGEDFTVNGTAKVVCGNVQTANATVYLIDTVLMPK